jgi:putative CocE/NonD family hydrolase
MNRTGKIVAGLALALVATSCVHLISRGLGVPLQEKGRARAQMNLMAPMRDGVRLAIDLYFPPGPGPFPVVLTRLPYGTDNLIFKELGRFMARQGYLFAAQDTRGTFNSEGVYFPLIFESDDGHDTIAWILQQPWCNGKVGMWGGSYFGYTQWESAPDNPALAAMTPLYASGSMFKVLYRGGAQEYASWTGWNAQMEQQQEERAGRHTQVKADFSQGYSNEPRREAKPVDMAAVMKDPARLARGVEPWLHHPGDIVNAPCLNFDRYYSHTSAPAFMVAGWYDLFLSAQLEDFVRLRAEGRGDAKKSRLIIGPWTHGLPSSKYEDSRLTGPRLYGQGFIGWFNYWLKGEHNDAVSAAPLKIFVMGENQWRDEWEWPLKRTVFTEYYLHSAGQANSSAGDGALSTEKPDAEPEDRFDYDPKNPVPTAGGSFLGQKELKAGAKDQRAIEKRQDVLVYVTPRLLQPVEVTGPIQLTLYAASSAQDTDWTAKLVDISPNGKVQNLQDGIVRARYRDGYEKPSLLEPGRVYQYTLDLWAFSNVFLPGHRIGLEISSSNFPQFDRNTNAGGEGGPGNVVVAHQAIYHRADYPTHLTLPVIPR